MKKSTVLIVLIHLAYWLSLLAGEYLDYLTNSEEGEVFEIFNLTNWPVLLISVIVFYLFYFLLFPRFLNKLRLMKFCLWGLIVIAFAVTIGIWFGSIFTRTFVTLSGTRRTMIMGYDGLWIFTRIARSAIAACIMKGFITWFTEIRYKEQLEKQNVATSLELLKAKINPHFLFNTLNNIDVLIEKDATTASVYLKKLSDILRFTLYESPSDTIPLKRELDYILQYIDLQKIRTSNPHFVTVDFSGAKNEAEIAPMLFIPFIENAFKYSTNKKIDNAIVINIATQANTITFNCNNVYDANEQITGEGGLGLTIMKERLQLLYPGKHQLEINKTAERFIVNLTITIA